MRCRRLRTHRELDGPEDNMVYEVRRFVDLVDGKEAATADQQRVPP